MSYIDLVLPFGPALRPPVVREDEREEKDAGARENPTRAAGPTRTEMSLSGKLAFEDLK